MSTDSAKEHINSILNASYATDRPSIYKQVVMSLGEKLELKEWLDKPRSDSFELRRLNGKMAKMILADDKYREDFYYDENRNSIIVFGGIYDNTGNWENMTNVPAYDDKEISDSDSDSEDDSSDSDSEDESSDNDNEDEEMKQEKPKETAGTEEDAIYEDSKRMVALIKEDKLILQRKTDMLAQMKHRGEMMRLKEQRKQREKKIEIDNPILEADGETSEDCPEDCHRECIRDFKTRFVFYLFCTGWCSTVVRSMIYNVIDYYATNKCT